MKAILATLTVHILLPQAGVSVYLLDRCETPGGAQKSPWAVKKLNTKLNMDSTSKDL